MMWDFSTGYDASTPPQQLLYPASSFPVPQPAPSPPTYPHSYGPHYPPFPVLGIQVFCPCANAHFHSHNQCNHPPPEYRDIPREPAQSPPQQHQHQNYRSARPPKLLKARQSHARLDTTSAHRQAPNPVYSNCNGRKKALCIGINYRGHRNELRGCVNDARNVRKFLISRYGYKERDIVLLTDDTGDSRRMPTKRNILDAMRWLVKGACAHDSLFFHYSGHGGQTPDLDGDEVDGFDEVIYPVDHEKRGFIVDDEMHDIMVKPLAANCRLTAVFDSCHSGTVLDLPFIYSSHGRLRGDHVSRSARERKASKADVISWSACEDSQTSADTFSGGKAVGAMSYAFMTALNNNPKQSYQHLLKSIRDLLYPKYSQKPQLGSSHTIDTSLEFIM